MALIVFLLAFVDCCIGMVVAPIEPIIFQRRYTFEAFALGWARDGTALEVPFASCGAVDE